MTDHAYLEASVISYTDPTLDLRPIVPYWSRSTAAPLGPLVSPDMALDRAIRRATRRNAEQHSGHGHEPAPLYGMAEYCRHTTPDSTAAADGLDDLIDAEHERRHPGDTWQKAGYHERDMEIRQGFIVARLLDAMDEIYADTHSGNVCLADPQGYACAECDRAELEDGEGVESSGCRRSSDAHEAWGEFWYFQGDADNRGTALPEAG